MDPYYYLVNKHKVRLLSWSETRHKFLVEMENGTAQYVAESLLQKTDEKVPEQDPKIEY